MRPLLLVTAALFACQPPTDDTADDTDTAVDRPDLTSAVPSGAVRAGVVWEEASLWGGITSEGRPGDIKIYNDRARFVIQGMRDANYYVTTWGGVIDADVARAPGDAGRDIVEKWLPMAGIGRIVMPTAIEVVSDGSDGTAVVRVEGIEAPLALIEGTLEAPGFVADLGLRFTLTYTLEPDSALLQVTSEVTADRAQDLAMADLLWGSPEVAHRFTEGVGRGDGFPPAFDWTAYVADARDVAVATLAVDTPLQAGSLELIASLADIAIASGPVAPVGGGTTLTERRYYGVAADLATLTDEALARRGTTTAAVSGTVTADDGPVAGAEVAVLVDDAPYTVTVTGVDGTFSAQAPTDGTVTTLAIGRGTGRFVDTPHGIGHTGPYAADSVAQAQLARIATPDADPLTAEGRGVGTSASPLHLGAPATIDVHAEDGGPFAVIVRRTTPDVAVDTRLVAGRPSGAQALGWARGGTLTLAVEPGTYDVVVHRGIRFEVARFPVTLAAGETATLQAALDAAYTPTGWLLGDPHSHAAPSGDGEIPMEDRLVVATGVGVQVHFGTDHDHLADYRPLVTALDLDGQLRTVVSDEVSPPLRGHMNIYPVVPDLDAPNHGAWPWWDEIPDTTEQVVDFLRARHGDAFTLQLNHPLDKGVAEMAGWSPGRIARGDHWTTRFQAVEVLNGGDVDSFFAFWMDALVRGVVSTPVGVSDSHTHTGGHVGMSATFLGAGVDAPDALTDDLLVDTMAARRTIATRGPFLDLSVAPGSVVAPGTEVEVTVRAPAWIVVDRILVYKDGALVHTLPGTTATVTLEADADAAYVIAAEGDTPMQPVDDRTPWAAASAYLVDVGGDGWTAPLAPLTVED
ncbi:MAG: CehA/McbA family metallohydrolase [Alphaproteobacteria bacterium]|nr:CehA/McbA family metallohydrolase [Alphaproteobacteria bacterium]